MSVACSLSGKITIANLHLVRSKSSYNQVMRIKVSFILLSRASLPREKGALWPVSWYCIWAHLGKSRSYNLLYLVEGFEEEDPWREGQVISLQLSVRYAKVSLKFPNLTDLVSWCIAWAVWTCSSQFWVSILHATLSAASQASKSLTAFLVKSYKNDNRHCKSAVPLW